MSLLKTLVAVEADLASSIAIRYVCQLVKLTDMGLQALYVAKPDEPGHTPGTGWVRQTWEDAVVQKDLGRISQLIREEKDSCPGLGNPKMVVGERDMEILHELRLSDYDFFTEGLLHAFEPVNFLKKIHSILYRNLPCPVLLVKNMVSLERGVLALGEENDLKPCLRNFLKLFKGVQVDLDILCCRFQKPENAAGREELPPGEGGLHAAEKLLSDKDRMPRKIRIIQGTPQSLEGPVRDYGLVLASLSRENIQKSPLVDLLSRCPSPILIDWR